MFVTVTALKFVLHYVEVSDHVDIFLNYLIQFYLNNTRNIRLLSQRIISCYTHKMAIVS